MKMNGTQELKQDINKAAQSIDFAIGSEFFVVIILIYLAIKYGRKPFLYLFKSQKNIDKHIADISLETMGMPEGERIIKET